MDKKGLSEIIGYVMLILIAVSLSVGVYVGLKTYIPLEKPSCPDSISVVMKETSCDAVNDKVTVVFQNKGLFKVDGAYIKAAGTDDGSFSYGLNPLTYLFGKQLGFFYFPGGLSPNDESTGEFEYKNIASSIKKIQIEPFIRNPEKKNKIIVCEQAIITQKVVGCD